MRTWLLLTAVATLLATIDSDSCGTAPALKRTRRLINGDKVHPHQFPWMASIQITGVHICGGTLINHDYVVTAAHCLHGLEDAEVNVVLGLHHLIDDGIPVSGRAIIHPEYAQEDGIFLNYDIALVHLSQPVPFGEHVQPICLPERDGTLEEDEVIVTLGWGLETTRFGYITVNNVSDSEELEKGFIFHALSTHAGKLKQATLHVKNIEECDRLYDSFNQSVIDFCENHLLRREERIWCRQYYNANYDTNSLLSTKDGQPFICGISYGRMSSRKSVCTGDSGGPLMKQSTAGSWVLVGVASGAPYDCHMLEKAYPPIGGYFSDVTYNLKWIAEVITEQSPARSTSASSLPSPLVLYLLLVRAAATLFP